MRIAKEETGDNNAEGKIEVGFHSAPSTCRTDLRFSRLSPQLKGSGLWTRTGGHTVLVAGRGSISECEYIRLC